MKRTRWLKWSLTACSLLATVAGWEALATADLHAGAVPGAAVQPAAPAPDAGTPEESTPMADVRVAPTTSWPPAMSSGTSRLPMAPVPPARKIFIVVLPSNAVNATGAAPGPICLSWPPSQAPERARWRSRERGPRLSDPAVILSFVHSVSPAHIIRQLGHLQRLGSSSQGFPGA